MTQMQDCFLTLNSASEAETQAIARDIEPFVGVGDLVAIVGDLGVGKSVFCRAFIRSRLRREDLEVPSPTFTLVQTYAQADGVGVWHADLYRLSDPDEVAELGFDEGLADNSLLVEWPDRLPENLLVGCLVLSFEALSDGTRRLHFMGGQEWQEKLRNMGG